MESNEYQNTISDDYTEMYQRLPITLLLSYGVGHVLNDVCASMWFTYLLVFFHLVLEFDNWQAGFVLLVGQIADAVATPFVGFHSDLTDNFWLCRYGKRKTWHLLGSVCVLGAFPFIFSPCIECENSPQSAQLFYFSVFIVIFQFGWAAVQISHLSLIPELTPNEHDRTKLTAIRYSFTVFSNLLVYVITWAVLHINSESKDAQIGPNDIKKFQFVVWIGLGIGVLCTIIFHCFVQEDNNGGGTDVRGSEIRPGVKQLLCSLEVYQVAAVYMSTRLFVNLSQVFIPLYLHETLNMAAQALAIIPLTVFLSSFVTSLFIELMNRKLGRKVTYILGAVIGIVACGWIQVSSNQLLVSYEIYCIAVLLGTNNALCSTVEQVQHNNKLLYCAGGSIILVTSLGITADLIGKNTGNGAFIYGLMSFTDKLANGIAVVIIQDLHSNKNYYRDILTYVCGGSAIFGILSVLSLIRNCRGNDYEILANSNTVKENKNYAVINSAQEDMQPALIS